jgi:hypothetical protein
MAILDELLLHYSFTFSWTEFGEWVGQLLTLNFQGGGPFGF